jgi:nitroreductase
MILGFLLTLSASTFAEELKPIKLPKPRMDGGRPLMEVLKDRKSTRDFSPERLPLQELSNLLWAAFGVNRPEVGKRTAPSARNKQEMDIYVAIPDGLFLYEAKEHTLKPILKEDIREKTGGQPFVKEAAVNLVYVADYSRMEGYTIEQKEFYSACNTGFISQNVYPVFDSHRHIFGCSTT